MYFMNALSTVFIITTTLNTFHGTKFILHAYMQHVNKPQYRRNL